MYTFFGHADLQTSLVAALATDVAFTRPDFTFGILIAFVWFCSQQTPMEKALLFNSKENQCVLRHCNDAWRTCLQHNVHVHVPIFYMHDQSVYQRRIDCMNETRTTQALFLFINQLLFFGTHVHIVYR